MGRGWVAAAALGVGLMVGLGACNAGNDFYIWYLHVDSVPAGIANGSHVEQGQLLAYSGNSGCSSGPHIHLETASVAVGQPAYINQCSSVNPASRDCP